MNRFHFFPFRKESKMKWFVLSSLMIIGFCHAELSDNGRNHKKVLKRIVKRALEDVGSKVFINEPALISYCKANGHPELDLGDTYRKMKQCVGKKALFVTDKAEYISNLEECSRDAIMKTRDCLAEDQKYFPDFILDLVKSQVSVAYDDYDIIRYDFLPCILSTENFFGQRKYKQCLTDTTARTHDTAPIPSSKKSFCDQLIRVTRCLSDLIKDNCRDTERLRKFRNDYARAPKIACGIKESS